MNDDRIQSADGDISLKTSSDVFRTGVWDKDDIVSPDGIEWHRERFLEAANEIYELTQNFSPETSDDVFRTLLRRINEFYDSGNRYKAWHEVAMFEDGTEETINDNEEASNLFDDAEKKLLTFKDAFSSLTEIEAQHFIEIAGLDAAWLEKIREKKTYQLSHERENHYVQVKQNVITRAISEYQKIISALKVTFRGAEYTYGEMVQFIISDDRETRREAALSMEEAIAGASKDLFEQYKIIVKALYEESVERGLGSPLGLALIEDRVPESAATALLAAIQGNFDIYHGYLARKAQLLGIENIATFDLSAPIKSKDTDNVKGLDYHELITATIAAMQAFHPRFAAHMEECLKSNHILSKREEGTSPQPGEWAFPISPNVVPYALFIVSDETKIGAGHIRAISHELGHVGHFGAKKELTPLSYHDSRWTVEVASLLSEILTAEYLQQTNPSLAREVLAAQIDSLLVNVFKAGSLAMQEVELHRLIAEEGGEYEDFYTKLKSLTVTMYGEDVEVTPESHLRYLMTQQLIATPMQVISYPAGALTALAIYNEYKVAQEKGEGNIFAERVMSALSAGGSITPSEFLKIIQGDEEEDSLKLTSEEFWMKGLNALRDIIERMDS